MTKKGDPQVELEIEKNIPIPPRGRKPWSKYKDLIERMGVDDSVVVSTMKEATTLAITIRRHLGLKPATRRLEDGSYRVWVTDELLKSTKKEDMNVTT